MARLTWSGRGVAQVLLSGFGLVGAPIECAANAQVQGAAITGIVHDSLGARLADVELRVEGSIARARSDDSGGFHLVGLASGPAVLIARRLGFRGFSRPLRLRPGETLHLDIELGSMSEELAGIRVTASPEVFDSRLAGFWARSRLNIGHFVTRERIDRANSTTLSDMLREMPGVRIGPSRNQGKSIRLRGASCPPLVFVDGFPASAGEFDIDMIDLKSVEGIEVYSGNASVPPEFLGPRDLDRCGVIAIWSRPARPRQAGVPDSMAQP
jgi:hypothetical protein